MSSEVETLELLSLFSNRLSHSMRTPLGVCMGLVDDLLKGFTLSQTELQDGKNSLRQLLTILDGLKEISSRTEFEPRVIAVQELFDSELHAHFGGMLQVLSGAPILQKASVDAKLLGRALRLCVAYLLAKSKKSAPDRGKVTIKIVSAETVAENLRTSRLEIELCGGGNGCEQLPVLPGESIEEVLRRDHSLEALGLVFAERVVALHQGYLCVREHVHGENQIQIGIQCSHSDCLS